MRTRRAAALLAAPLFVALSLAIGNAGADIYRCTDANGTSFRDKPCTGKQKGQRFGPRTPYAGCFQVEDSAMWEGGRGVWRFQVAALEGGYLFKETAAVVDGELQPAEAANLPMHNASPDEVEAAAQQLAMKVTGGMVVELPASALKPDAPPRVMGLFNAWDASGKLHFVAYLPFVNGYIQRVACP